MWRVFCSFAVVAGCTSSNAVECGDGIVCPDETECRQLTMPDEPYCATSAQLEACANAADGDACDAGYCHDGVCLPIVCGNNRIDRGEACDDGNTLTGDGTCSGDCSSNETCGNGVVDPLRIVVENGQTRTELREGCDDGNFLSGDGCASNCTPELPRWEQLGLTPPPPALGASVSYDSARRRIVMFGGGAGSSAGNKRGFNATYEWDGRAWISLPGTGPAPRWSAAMAYDARRHRHVMFGGQDIVVSGEISANGFRETWEWDGSRWDLRRPATEPVGRIGSAMVFDSRRGVIVLFGGRTLLSTGGTLADTWEYDGVDWKQATPTMSPPPRAYHAMAYDPKRGVVVMVGGESGVISTPAAVMDAWEYNGTTWTPAPTPPVEVRHTMLAYDALNSRLITYGGGAFSSATLAYNGTWTTLTPTTIPGPRRDPSLVADPINGTILMFGGGTTATTETDTTYRWTGSDWDGPLAMPSVPTGASRSASAYDATRGVAWLFGGAFPTDSELWSFDGVSWQLSQANPPTARNEATMAYDVARDELVLFGGNAADPATWIYDMTTQTWSSTTPVPSPPNRDTAVMAYDIARQRTVLHAGVAGPNFVNDVWEWDGTAWVDKTPVGATIPPRSVGSATYHPGIGVLIQNGFYTNELDQTVLTSDLWTWDGTDFRNLVMLSPVASRGYGSLIYSGGLNRSVDFAGLRLGGQPFDDTWEYDGTSWTQSVVEPPPARGAHVSFPGRNGSDVMVFGGVFAFGSPSNQDLWRYRYANKAPRELCTIDVDNDGDQLAGCADPDCWATCTPLCPPDAPAASCPADAPSCGDGVCNASLENCRICDADCDCPAVCGDTFCDAGETSASCPGDCP